MLDAAGEVAKGVGRKNRRAHEPVAWAAGPAAPIGNGERAFPGYVKTCSRRNAQGKQAGSRNSGPNAPALQRSRSEAGNGVPCAPQSTSPGAFPGKAAKIDAEKLC